MPRTRRAAHPRGSFRVEVLRALREKGPPPPDLIDYQVACFFWQRCGIVSEPPLDEWDIDKIERWLTVGELVDKYQEALAKAEQNASRGGH